MQRVNDATGMFYCCILNYFVRFFPLLALLALIRKQTQAELDAYALVNQEMHLK